MLLSSSLIGSLGLKFNPKVLARLLSILTTKQREGFGSFHSQDVEKLIRQPESEYKTPTVVLEVEQDVPKQSSCVGIGFGKELKKQLFMLRDSDIFINHGAFGGAIKPLHELAAAWRNRLEKNPLDFFDHELLPVVAHSVRVMATHLRCPATELIPLPNVTTGLNSIFNSLTLEPNDHIICFSLTYGATKTMLRHLAARTGAKLIIIDLPLPIASSDTIVTALQAHLSHKTKLVVLDQVTSNTALALPVHKLGRLAKEAGATVVVDAAHVLFNQDVHIYPNMIKTYDNQLSTNSPEEALHDVCDVWLSNGHKWLCMPRGCAYMWVHPRLHGLIRPAILSHGYTPGVPSSSSKHVDHANLYVQEGRLLSAFIWDGCRDYASVLCTASALHFWHHTFPSVVCSKESNSHNQKDTVKVNGWEVARRYNRQLLEDAVQVLETDWAVSCERQVAPSELTEQSPMRLVSVYLCIL